MAFPAVSFSFKQVGSYDFLESKLVRELEFDCTMRGDPCMERSAKLRRDVSETMRGVSSVAWGCWVQGIDLISCFIPFLQLLNILNAFLPMSTYVQQMITENWGQLLVAQELSLAFLMCKLKRAHPDEFKGSGVQLLPSAIESLLAPGSNDSESEGI